MVALTLSLERYSPTVAVDSTIVAGSPGMSAQVNPPLLEDCQRAVGEPIPSVVILALSSSVAPTVVRTSLGCCVRIDCDSNEPASQLGPFGRGRPRWSVARQ